MHNYEPSGLGEGREVCCNMSWGGGGGSRKNKHPLPLHLQKKLHMTNGGRQKESNSKSRTPD